MFYYILAQEKAKGALREADKNRLIEIAKRSRRIQKRRWLANLACRFGLTRTRECEDNSVSQQQLGVDYIKEMTYENSSY